MPPAKQTRLGFRALGLGFRVQGFLNSSWLEGISRPALLAHETKKHLIMFYTKLDAINFMSMVRR